jgi:uncharacterized protein (DUF1499 family)
MSDSRPRAVFASLAILVAIVTGLVAILSGFGTKWGIWDYRTGFTLLRWGAWGGLSAVAAGITGAVMAWSGGAWRGFAVSLLAIAIGAAAFAVPYQARQSARSVPPIHDISTDTTTPPQFRALVPMRKGARNPAAYDGPAATAQQQKAYPDLKPAMLARSHAEAYQAALVAAASQGWTIIAKAPAEGRIEATDRSFWFGFTDDIVIRVSATDKPGESRIDLRSKSRVGRSDAGTNAKRVRAFLAAITGR